MPSEASAPEPQRRGLGRGLEALMGGKPGTADLLQLPVSAIEPNPRQPRRVTAGEEPGGLAASVRAQGLLQPVVVRPRGFGRYELIAGERRWRAAREAGLASVPALVREADDRDSLLLALVENVAREQLSALEEARAYAVLTDEFGLALSELARRVGRSQPGVSNRLRLLELPDDVLTMLERGELSETHARAVLGVPDRDGQRRLARRIVREGLSVRAAERAARSAGARTKPRRKLLVDPALAERARAALERVAGRRGRVLSGRLELPFQTEVELAEIVEALERAAESTGEPVASGESPGSPRTLDRPPGDLHAGR